MCCIHPPTNSSLKQAKLNPQDKGEMTIVKSEYTRWGRKKQKEEKRKENTREIVGEVKGRKTGRLMKSIKDKKKKSWGLQ